MREIKFRAWNIKNEYYDYDLLCNLADNEEYEIGLSCWSIAYAMQKGNDIGFIFEQYTGLKDKNGHEIYEGDILHIGNLNEIHAVPSEVVFYEGSFCIILAWAKDARTSLFLYKDCCKKFVNIIGNIHENPELLE